MIMMMTYLVYILLSSWTSISELLNSFSSFLMAACKQIIKQSVSNHSMRIGGQLAAFTILS